MPKTCHEESYRASPDLNLASTKSLFSLITVCWGSRKWNKGGNFENPHQPIAKLDTSMSPLSPSPELMLLNKKVEIEGSSVFE